MSVLISILGTGKGTWFEVHKLLEQKLFDSVLLFVDEWAVQNYRNEYNAIVVPLATEATSEQLIEVMKHAIKQHMVSQQGELDIAINISSGTGKQHAALLAAVMQLGYGIRLVTLENGEFKVLL